MTVSENKQLQLDAVKVREGILTAIHTAGSGHPGSSLSCADVLTYLYEKEMRVDPKDPAKKDRDRFVLSKGHAAPALYSMLAACGYFPASELETMRKPGSILQGHPNLHTTPGVDVSTGSLGQGISVATGMAKGAKMQGSDVNVYALIGDGELEEGQVWEAVMFAAHYKLDNLCIMVDMNGLQIDGPTKEVMNSAPLADKFAAFGCDVITADAHDFEAIENAFASFHENKGKGKPTCILFKSVKGKGVSFMEDNVAWHGKAPNDEQYEQAMNELAAERGKIEEG